MEDNASPFMLRRRLRTQLVAARAERDLTQQQVAEAMDWSMSKMNRIEKAKTGISTNDLRVLLPYYGIKDQERVKQLLALARAAKQNPWWQSYSDVASPELLELMNYESAASAISQFEPTFVPGILQTEEYASAVLQVFNDERPGQRVERLVKLRTERRGLLSRENAPRFSFVLDESVIRRVAGSHAVMTQQLQHLVNIGKLQKNITIQIVPFTAGLHRGMKGAFEIVQFEDTPDENVVFLEGSKDFINEDIEEVQEYLEIFGHITDAALEPEESLKLLEATANST